MKAKHALASYQQNKVLVETNVDNHQIVLMLMEGALQKINEAKAAITQNKIAKKGEAIGLAISIIEGLSASIDPNAGEISDNLSSLYDYSINTLLKANLNSDIQKLDEVYNILNELRSGWQDIRPEALKILGGES